MFHDYGILNFWTFLAGALVIIIVPGPNSLYVLRTGISRGTGAAYRGCGWHYAGRHFSHFSGLGRNSNTDSDKPACIYRRQISRRAFSLLAWF